MNIPEPKWFTGFDSHENGLPARRRERGGENVLEYIEHTETRWQQRRKPFSKEDIILNYQHLFDTGLAYDI